METKKYIFCDMDGTLLNDKKEIPKDFFPLMRRLRERAVFAVCSGRQYETLRRDFAGCEEGMIFIADNGGLAYQNGVCLWAETMDETLALEALRRCRKKEGLFPIFCGAECAYVEDLDSGFLENARMYYKKLRIVDRLEEIFAWDRVIKVAVYDAARAADHAYPVMRALEEDCQVAVSGAEWVDLMKAGVNKGMAVRRIKELYHLTDKDCAAFGDYRNDYEMMRECYYSYAMENAVPEIKDICRFRAPSNNEGGVVTGLLELFGN